MKIITITDKDYTLPDGLLDAVKLDPLAILDDSLDSVITDQILSSAESIEADCGVAILPATWTVHWDRFDGPNEYLWLPVKATSITSVKIYDSSNNQVSLTEGTDYFFAGNVLAPHGYWKQTYSRPDAIEVVFEAGSVTWDYKVIQLVKLLVDHKFNRPEEREPPAIKRLQNHIRNWGVK